MKCECIQNMSRVVRVRIATISIARWSTRIVSPVTHRNSSTFLHPFARSALPDFIARMGALTPAGRVLRLSEHERPTTSQQVSLLVSFDLPTIPPSTTLLPFPSRRFVTLHQRERLPRLSPGQTNGRRECRRAVWGSPVARRLPDRLGRSRFALLRTGRSPPVASHPSSRRRSYFQLQVRNVNLVGTCTPQIKRLQRRTSHRRQTVDLFESNAPFIVVARLHKV